VHGHFQNAVSTGVDVFQAKSLLQKTKAIIPSLKVERDESMHRLNALLRINPSDLWLEVKGFSVARFNIAVGL